MGRLDATHLTREVTHYSLTSKSSGTTDCLMAQWFFEWWLPDLAAQFQARVARQASAAEDRPSWLMQEMRSQARAAGIELPGEPDTVSGRARLFSTDSGRVQEWEHAS